MSGNDLIKTMKFFKIYELFKKIQSIFIALYDFVEIVRMWFDKTACLLWT